MPVPTGGSCGSMKKMSCEDCKFYYDDRMQNFDDGKCVWIPSEAKCLRMKNVKKTPDLEFDEFCAGKYLSPVTMHDKLSNYNHPTNALFTLLWF